MFCALLTSRYQVSVYRTNGPLVLIQTQKYENAYTYHTYKLKIFNVLFLTYSYFEIISVYRFGYSKDENNPRGEKQGPSNE